MMAMGVVLWFVQATFLLYPLPRIEPGQKVYSRLRFAHKDMHLHTHEHMHTLQVRHSPPLSVVPGLQFLCPSYS